jgi:transcriptional regulator with XRE-family HTH domain
MEGRALKSWRQQQGLTQKRLALALGVTPMAVAYWEWGKRRIPALLPLALEALENRMRKEQEHGFTGGVSGVQKAE